MYTDDSLMPKGKYAFRKLSSIPAQYFLNIIDNGGGDDKDLKAWIESKLDWLREHSDFKGRIEEPIVEFICEKYTYPTEAEAKFKLKVINKDQRNHKKPFRAYECPHCSGWHLTSQEDRDYIKKGLQPKQGRPKPHF